MSTSLSIAMELLFVRHGDIRKRSEVSQVGKILKRPFDDFGTTNFDSSDQSTFVLPTPPPELRSLLIGRFPKQKWFSVFSDSASIDDIVAANNAVGRLQFARLKRDLVGKLVVLEVLSGGKVLGRCEAGVGPKGFTVVGAKDVRASVSDCADAESAMRALRESFQLDTALKTVVELDNGYSVIDERARELNPNVCALLILEGRKSAKKGSVKAPAPILAANASDGKPKSKVNLAAALTRLDAEGVRLAIKQGASLKKLTGFKVSPLHYVVQRFESPGARECAQALIEGGADIGNLVAECCTNIYGPQQSFDRAQFLIDHGGDVNAPLKAGVTAIFGACSHRHVSVVKLLMQHGADPDVRIPHCNATTVEWAEDMLRQETAPDRKGIYAEILTELRGVEVAVPHAAPLSDALIAENERFVAALQAQELLANLPAEFRLQDAEEHKLQDNPKFTRLHRELLAEGFQQTGLRIEASVLPVFIVTYTNEKRSMDAVVSDRWWSKEVACRIMSYGRDGSLYSVGNVSNPVDPNFDPDFLIRREHLRSRPKKLMLELAKLVKQRKATLLPTPPHEFASRYQSGNNRILDETKRLLNERLSRAAIRDDHGHPLRFERRRNYLSFSGFSDPDFSSRHLAELTLRDIEHTRAKDEPFLLTSIVRDCFTLLAMQRMQYAGVPRDCSFLQKGCDAGIELFQKLKSTWKKDLSMSLMTELGMAMLLCRMNDDDSGLRKLCDNVQPRMMTDSLRNPEDPPLAIGQALLAIVSHFRSKAVPKLADMKQQIAQSRCQRAKILLRALDSLERSDGRSLATSLRRSVELLAKQTDPNPHPNYLISKFAIPESILFDVGRKTSLIDDVPDEVADWMITK